MIAGSRVMWKRLSTEQKCELAVLLVGWQDRRARRIEAGLPASSSEGSNNDPTMEDSFDDESTPSPTPVHADFTLEQT